MKFSLPAIAVLFAWARAQTRLVDTVGNTTFHWFLSSQHPWQIRKCRRGYRLLAQGFRTTSAQSAPCCHNKQNTREWNCPVAISEFEP
jgi:hypothetical protein